MPVPVCKTRRCAAGAAEGAAEAGVETLEAYFACNGNLSEAARRLHLHRNSLLYRLERIQEVLHADLEDADTRLALQVALKMRHTLT